MRNALTIITLIAGVYPALAQHEMPERLPPGNFSGDTVPAYMHPAVTPSAPLPDTRMTHQAILEQVRSTLSLKSLHAPARILNRSNISTGPGAVSFRMAPGTSIDVNASGVEMPGLMNVESGSIAFTQRLGNLTVQAYANANHYGYFGGMQTSYGFGGNLNYRVNNRLSFTLFGSYSTGLTPITTAMAPYMSAPSFGGYASYDFNDHWGVSVGAQTTRSLVTNRWETQPILTPYYKINGKAALGVDVGGILYNILQTTQSKKGYRYNPTMRPPVGGPPPVAPRPHK